MAYFTVTDLKVLLFLLGVTRGIYPSSPKEPDLSMVANILQNLFKTYTNSLRETQNFVIGTEEPPQLEPTVERVINRKIQELKPFLQDYDKLNNLNNIIKENNYIREGKSEEHDKKLNNLDDNITLEGEEETTIIEFYPDSDIKKPDIRLNDHKPTEFKENVKKYKIIRDKIKRALIEESVSFKTQRLVTYTLDDMLAIMVRSQCPANSNLDSTRHNSVRSQNIVRRTKDLAKKWTDQWQTIKDKYNRITKEHFSQQANPARKLFMFFEQIQEFLTNIVNDSEHIFNNYKVVCKLVKKDNNMDEIYFNNRDLVNFRTGKDRKKYDCPTFNMCSQELRRFMGRFYNYLNDTAVSTFRNYAAMYKSDVNSDGSGEKESVIAVINRLTDDTEQTITKTFIEATENFDINHDKDNDLNIGLLRFYISDTIEKCLHTIKRNVNGETISLRDRLIDSLKQDLKANTRVDLENLAVELKDGICRDFMSCNSRIMRHNFNDFDNEVNGRAHKPVDKNKVYVKLQMNFDKKLKEDIARGNVDILDYAFAPMKNVERQQYITVTQIINVTRTTQSDKSTQAEIPENFERSPKLEKTFMKHKSSKKHKIERTLKKENSENNSETEESQKNLLKDRVEKTLKKDKSKTSSKKQKIERTLKEENLENNSESKESKEKSENNSETEESGKISEKDHFKKKLKKKNSKNIRSNSVKSPMKSVEI